MDRSTISNIGSGKTKQPKTDFFEAIAVHYPEWLFWILTGEERYYPAGGEDVSGYVVREGGPKYEKPPGKSYEQLIETVNELARALAAELEERKKVMERLERVEWEMLALRREKETLAGEVERMKGGGR